MSDIKTITVNRKAFHDYSILETVEAGIVLTGTEIKSIRAGQVNLRESYAKPEGREFWLYNTHIAQYDKGNIHNHDPNRPRKLLLHRKQIAGLSGKVSQKSLTVIPLKIYIKRGVAKVELGLGRGKKLFDKREAIAKRDMDREVEREIKSYEMKR